jgi:hypothetical protein
VRHSRRSVPSSLDYGAGTWTEVLYWLSRRAAHCRRQALRSSDLHIIHNYRIYAEACEATIGYLDHNLRRLALEENWYNSADNPQLSAPKRKLRK